MPAAEQSTPFDQLLDSVALGCAYGSGLDRSKVAEWFGDEREIVEGQQVVTYKLGDWLPDEYPGANREGMTAYLSVEITLWTQMKQDKASVDKWRMRNSGTGHLPRYTGLLDWFDGEVLFTSYNSATYEPTGTPLSWEPLMQMPSKFAERVKRGDETWIKSVLVFRTRIAKPLTV